MSILRRGEAPAKAGATLPCLLRAALILICVFSCLVAASPASAARPLRTTIVDPGGFATDPTDGFAKTRETGATFVRLVLDWRHVAPVTEPLDPTDPTVGYSWTTFDLQVEGAVAAGLTPFICIVNAPDWAETGTAGPPGARKPDATKLGQFARAASRHYSGDVGAKPWVKYWQVWNEPNRDYFLQPQFEGKTMVSPALYRAMVNRFSEAVHDVNPLNRVIAGGLAPLGRKGKPAPLTFMQKLLASTTKFDIWAHHPYTSGGPLHRPPGSGDIALGNLDKMKALLKARDAKIQSVGAVDFWVTEFSWDSKPPDPDALAATLHRRWIAEALYRMWVDGVTLVTWFRYEDDPLTGPGSTPYQSGFWTTGGAKKQSLVAFRFPVVALTQKKGILVWGRTPLSSSVKVRVQIKTGSAWKNLSSLQSSAAGIFQKTYKVPYRKGHIRAIASGETSIPFSLTYAKDRFVNPFGCGGPIAC